MGRVVSMPLAGGGEVLIEAAEDASGAQRVGRGDVVRRATETLQESLGKVRPAAEAVLDEFRRMDTTPSKIKVQFGVKLTGEANLAVAKSSGEANFTVTLEWEPKDS
ncbi:CU044_2847 family protein [Saccharopolyspora gregorii]